MFVVVDVVVWPYALAIPAIEAAAKFVFVEAVYVAVVIGRVEAAEKESAASAEVAGADVICAVTVS
jgi:hypothetical protein